MSEEVKNLSLVSNAFKILIEHNIIPNYIQEFEKITEINTRLKNLIGDLDKGGVDFCHHCYGYLDNNFNICGICQRGECSECIESQDMSRIIKICVKCDIGICEKCDVTKPDYITLDNVTNSYYCENCVP